MTRGNIEYWIDHASEHPENNGIQRVCRYLARGLRELCLLYTSDAADE